MPDVPQQPGPGQQPEAPSNGVSTALGRQIGPLKAWQWGILVAGAYLLYRYATTGSLFGGGDSSSGTTAAFVPVSTGEGSGNVPTPTPNTTTPKPTTKTITTIIATVTRKTAIYNKSGKVIAYVSKGTYKVGPRIKVAGRWLYPILSKPGQYLSATPAVTYKTTTSVVPATTGSTLQIMSPVTTNLSNPMPVPQAANITAPFAIDQATQIPAVQINPYTN